MPEPKNIVHLGMLYLKDHPEWGSIPISPAGSMPDPRQFRVRLVNGPLDGSTRVVSGDPRRLLTIALTYRDDQGSLWMYRCTRPPESSDDLPEFVSIGRVDEPIDLNASPQEKLPVPPEKIIQLISSILNVHEFSWRIFHSPVQPSVIIASPKDGFEALFDYKEFSTRSLSESRDLIRERAVLVLQEMQQA